MHYEILVVKDGFHFFATSDRSLVGESEMLHALRIFKEKFPKDEGYEISVSIVRHTHERLDIVF